MKQNILDKMKQNRQLILFIMILAVLYSFLYRNLLIDKMWAFGDLMPFPSNVGEATNRFLYVWQNQYLGYPFFSKPYHLFTGFLVFFLGIPAFTQKILFLSLMPLAGFSMYLFVKRFVRSEVGRYFASILYSLNPHTIGLFIDGKIIAFLYYSVAPLLILQFLKMFEENNRVRNVLTFSVLFGLFFHNLYAAFWVIIPFVTVYTLVEFLTGKNNRRLLFRVVPSVLFALSLGFLLQTPSINQVMYIRESIPVEVMMNYVDYSYSKGTIPNLIRLAGNAGNRMNAVGYNKVQWWTIFGFVIPFLAFSSLVLLHDQKEKMRVRICLACATLILLITGFTWLTYIRVTYPLFYAFPYLFSLRNLNKLMHPLSLAFSVLAGVGLDGILARIRRLSLSRHNVQRVLVFSFLSFIFLSMALYTGPAVYTGDMVLSKVRDDGYIVPDSYYDIVNWITKQKQSHGFFRTLWLPYTYETKASTQLRLNWLDPRHVGIRHGGGEQLGIPEWQISLVEDLFGKICEQKTVNFGKLLAIMSVKYVIVDLTSDVGRCKVTRRYGAPFITGNSSYFIEFLNKQNDLKSVYSNKEFIIYENDERVVSHVSIYDSSIFVVGSSGISSLLAMSDLPNLSFSEHLIFFERGLPEVKALWKLNMSDIVVFVQSSPSKIREYSEYTLNKTVLLVYEEEALRFEDGTLALNFWAPNNGFYKIALKGSSDDATIQIDGSISVGLSFGSYGEIKSFHLNKGVHKIEFKSPKAVLDRMVIFSTAGNESLEDIFLMDETSSNELEESQNVGGQITVRASLEKPSFLVLSEFYHDSWKAYIENGKIKHLRASLWANGFYIPTIGDVEVRLTFGPQNSRNLTVAIWVASWIVVLIGLIYNAFSSRLYDFIRKTDKKKDGGLRARSLSMVAHAVALSHWAKLVDRFYRLKGTSWHEHLHSTCSRLHIPTLAHKVDVILFKNLIIWEPEVSNCLADTKGELFVDVGAGYGRYTVLLAEKYRQVIAIEPEPRNMQIIKSNVKYARLTNVQFLQCAVSDKVGYAYLYLDSHPAWHTLCSNMQKEKFKVKTQTLASILRDRWTDLVKVDVEGAELSVLKGAEPIIEKIKSWVVELHNPKRKRELEEWFISRGYSIRWLEKAPKSPKHIYAWKNSLKQNMRAQLRRW